MTRAILLVEDNPSDEKLTLLAFKRSGISNEVVVVRDGPAAIAYLLGDAQSEAPLPALMLLDLNLPKVGGLEVLQRIRQSDRTRLLPVVILTSSREEEDIARSYALGANAYVRKPVDFAEFAQAARTVGLFWLLLNELPPSTP